MAVLVVWYKWKMRNFLIIQLLILCMATLELMAQSENCKDPLGIESGTIRGDQITASSSNGLPLAGIFPESYPPDFARLHGNSAWVSHGAASNSNPWIQVDFERTLWVTGVATQGYSIPNRPQSWVAAYYIQYANVGMGWQTIQNDQNISQIFPGNFDGNTTVRNNFTSPISLRHIRIYPILSPDVRQAVLRFELYGCEASDPTTISPEFKDEGSLKDLIIVGVAVGSFFILLVGVDVLIRCRKRVCKRDKVDAKQIPSTKDTEMIQMQEKSAEPAPNQDHYQPYRKGSDQATYEELRKSHITNDANSEKVTGNLDESDQTYDEIKET